jgi:hypothetical protein
MKSLRNEVRHPADPASRHDPPIRRRRGNPPTIRELLGDRGYDHAEFGLTGFVPAGQDVSSESPELRVCAVWIVPCGLVAPRPVTR